MTSSAAPWNEGPRKRRFRAHYILASVWDEETETEADRQFEIYLPDWMDREELRHASIAWCIEKDYTHHEDSHIKAKGYKLIETEEFYE